MRSGIKPFREVRMSRAFLIPWRADMHELHRYWPSMVEDEQRDFKRRERLEWIDEREKKLARRGKKK